MVALTRMHARSMAWICLRAYQCHTCLNRSGSSCKCAGRSCARWLGDNASRYSKCFNLHACPSSKGNVELVGALRTISAKCGWTQPGAFTWTASRPSGLSYSAPRARPPPRPPPAHRSSAAGSKEGARRGGEVASYPPQDEACWAASRAPSRGWRWPHPPPQDPGSARPGILLEKHAQVLQASVTLSGATISPRTVSG